MGLREEIAGFTAQRIRSYLRAAKGNVQRAAQLAGLNRTHLHRLMVRHNVKNPCRPAQRRYPIVGRMRWREG